MSSPSLSSISHQTFSTSHTLTTMYLITNNTRAFAFVSDKNVAQTLLEKLTHTYGTTLGPFHLQKISAFLSRIYEIGKNLFEHQAISQQISTLSNQEILDFRNRIINEFLQRCSMIDNAHPLFVWKKMQQKYEFLKEFETMEEFHSYIIDILKFIRKYV